MMIRKTKSKILSFGLRTLAATAFAAGTLSLAAPAANAAHFFAPHYYGGPHFAVGIGLGGCCWGGYYPYWAAGYPYYYGYPYGYYPYAPYAAYHYTDVSSPLASPYVQQALAAPVGQSVTWTNGSVTTTRDGWSGQRYCREFRQDVTVDGRTQESTGTACQAANGGWQMVANQP